MLRKFELYFEIFGKYMKTKITAENEKDAADKLREKIKIHKIVDIKTNQILNIKI